MPARTSRACCSCERKRVNRNWPCAPRSAPDCSRIVRALVIESLLLGLIGGVLGVGVAAAGLRLLQALGPANLPRLHEIALDGNALAFTFAISVLSGLLFGLIPAVKYAAGRHLSIGLRGGGRTASQSKERHRARNVLVVAQVALALVLLVSSGLMIRTFQALRTVAPGFNTPSEVQTVRITIPFSLIREPERVARMQQEIVDKLAALPGVTSAGFASEMHMDGLAAELGHHHGRRCAALHGADAADEELQGRVAWLLPDHGHADDRGPRFRLDRLCTGSVLA